MIVSKIEVEEEWRKYIFGEGFLGYTWCICKDWIGCKDQIVSWE